MAAPEAGIGSVRARAFSVPTEGPEGDGTLTWTSTTLVVVEARAGGMTGMGYSYTDASAAALINGPLADCIAGCDAFDLPACWLSMRRRLRNMGVAGVAATAISAVDTALWDLKARLLDLPLASLLGRVRDSVPVYGSGGFTTMSDDDLTRQLAGWIERDGCRWVKMKIGAEAGRDLHRMRISRQAIGDAALFVDANGAFTPREALRMAAMAAELDVRWFEEPVSSDDLAGLRFVRDHAPPMMDIAAGEYGYDPDYFRRMLATGSVDVLQADATRCLGITGFLQAATLAEVHHVPMSAHCAPALHTTIGASVPNLRHLEWFADHVRIEAMLFDGAPTPRAGTVSPASDRPGLGLVFKDADAERFVRKVSA
ncbi:enolase C-terminal domain-like protein [Paracoccus beibuensis]|uniref:enolase C-terminal domain-like protein n=1 Tax=Paracoccus beibuensis TaxID=547602 RepID=UPI002240B958|nr:enolase C-terminal domain-like protein [Paracoccus beibuensis]